MADPAKDAFIRTPNKSFAVGQCELNLEPNAGAMDDIAGGREYHTFGFSVEPVDDQYPFLVVTDVDLYLDGPILEALDGLRLEVDTQGDDFADVEPPWIRPGSMVGMAEVIFEAPSIRNSKNWDPNAGKSLMGMFKLQIDRDGDLWRVEVELNHEGGSGSADGAPDFYAIFWSELDLYNEAEW